MQLDICIVNGPSFGVLSLFGGNSNCLKRTLDKIPIGLVSISQVIVLTDAKHVCNQTSSCSYFPSADYDADFLCISLFPCGYGLGCAWDPAGLSLGGAMAVASIIEKRGLKKLPCKIAFWSGDDNFEYVNVSANSDGRFVVTLERQHFTPNQNVLIRWNSKLQESVEFGEIDQEILTLQENLRKTNPDIHLSLFEEYDQNNISLKANLQAVPCYPLYIGEDHCVVPINTFGVEHWKKLENVVDNINFINRLSWMTISDPKFEKELEKHFSLSPNLAWSGVSRLKHKCGWTFLHDYNILDCVSSFDSQFMTIEPSSHHAPYGNSATGALASGIAYTCIHPEIKDDLTFRFRGHGGNYDNLIGAKLFTDISRKDRNLLVKRCNNIWSVSSHVAILDINIELQDKI